MTYLTRHPWDDYGSPPRPGERYDNEPEQWQCPSETEHNPRHTDREACVVALEDEVGQLEDEEQRYQDALWEAERATNQVRALLDQVQPKPVSSPGQTRVEVSK